MKILIDIGHPAHVHYFRNFIKIMEEKGHKFLIIAKDKNVTHELLNYYKIPFIKRRNYPKSLWGKLIQIPLTDLLVLRQAINFKPDVLLGFSGTHISHVGRLLGRPAIVFDDTEHAKFAHASYKSFASCILTPHCFLKDFGNKHIRFKGYMELCYLHKNYFVPDPSIYDDLNLNKDDKYSIIRFVSWSASHDKGQFGLDLDQKRKLVCELSKYSTVFISSEGLLPDDLKKYQIKIKPSRLHHALAYASLYVGEGATTASECSVLGTPNIYINSLPVCYCTEQDEKYNLCYNFRKQAGVIDKAIELIQHPSLREEYFYKKEKMLNDMIDVTAFIVWFTENYPESFRIMQENPDYQYRFK